MIMREDRNNRTIAIVRVSSRGQTDGISPETQKDEMVRYCEQYGLELLKVQKIVESAKDADHRTKFAAEINWARKNRVKHIVFYMYDRETRNLTDNEKNEKLVREEGISLHYSRERKVISQESTDSDFFMRDIHAVTSKQYIRILSTRVIDAFKTKAESGWYPQNRPPLGYVHERLKNDQGRERKRGSIIVPDSDERNVRQVRREFELRAQGHSFFEIRRRMIEEGLVPANKIKHYKISTIEGRIKNNFYWGYFTWRGVEYKGKHELIIPQGILDKVAETVGKRAFTRRPTAAFGGGWLKCADPSCGCAVTFDPKKKKIKATGKVKVFPYYRCSNGKRVHASLKQMNVPEQAIWNQLETAIECFTINPAFARDITAALNESHDRACIATKRQMADYQTALNALETKEDRVYEDFCSAILDKDGYHRQLEKIREQRRNFTRLMEQATLAVNGAYLETAKTIIELATDAKSLWNLRSPEDRKMFLKEVLSNPILDGVTVRYELKKPFLRLALMRENPLWRA